MKAFDIAVIGSGFAGSLFSMVAARLGLRVLLLEKGQHPRFVIGESSTPLANLLLEEIAKQYDLPRLLPLTAFGPWQRTYPQLACGLKRGFSFLFPQNAQASKAFPELLVAASPNDEVADTHWYREEFDAFLVEEAKNAGVTYWDRTSVTAFASDEEGATLTLLRAPENLVVRVAWVFDASGPRGCLHRLLRLDEAPFENLPRTRALFSHFKNVRPLDVEAPTNSEAPYPIDDAAVHHLFDGGWFWVLRFNNGVTSVGAAVTDRLAQSVDLNQGETAWKKLIALCPAVVKQLENAHPVQPFVHLDQLSFRAESTVGDRWVMLPSTASFVDPLLSTGFPLTLLGISRLGATLREHWGKDSMQSALRSYEVTTFKELDLTADLVSALYANSTDAEMFTRLSLLYFAAASFSETARRIGKPELAPGFLFANDAAFSSALRSICLDARSCKNDSNQRSQLLERIRQLIEPIDVAGLTRSDRTHHFPVDLNDLFSNAEKLGTTRDHIERCFREQGLVV